MSAAVIRLVGAWAALIALLALTVGMAFLPLGPAKPLVAYVIATAKASLVLWFFMELRQDNGLSRLAAAAGFVWISILLILSAADFIARS